jgi:type IV pilus assembly protein PilA
MALIVPQMLKVKKSANQTSAVQTIRTIGSAEVSYASLYPSNGYGCPLSVLGGNPQQTGSATAQAAQLIPADLAASGQKSGYTFAIACGAKATVNGQDVYTSYQLTAVPQTVGKSGDNGYCSDENNVIKIDPAGGSNCTEPLQ